MKKKLLFLIFLFGFWNIQSYGQIEEADSLNRLAWEIREQHLDSALVLNQIAINQASGTTDYSLIAKTISTRGVLLKLQGDYEKSTAYHFAALDIREKNNDSAGKISSLNNIGNNFYDLEQFHKAIEYHEKALYLAKTVTDTTLWIAAFNNMANDYREIENYAQAINMYDHALKLSVGDFEYEAIDIYLNIGIIYNCQDNWNLAISSLTRANQLLIRLDAYDDGMIFHNLSIAYEGLKQYNKAEDYLDKAYTIALSTYDLELLKDITKSQVILALKQNGNEAELAYFEHFIQLNDSLTDKQINSNIAEIDAKYNTEKKDAQLQLEIEEKKVMKAENEQHLFTIIGLLILLAVLLILSIFLFRFYAQKRKLNKLELEVKKQEIEQLMQGYELDLFEAQNFGQQEERHRIASDLHDRLGGLLAAVNLQIESLNFNQTEEEKNALSKVKTMIKDGIVEVRNVSHNLRSEALKSRGLKGALEAICLSITNSKKIKLDLYLDDLSKTSGTVMEREIYKIIMELISNTLRHAEASQITLQITEINNEFTIVFEDNGLGFEFEKNQSKGLGLTSIRERIQKLKGTWQVDSVPNHGTTVIINLPIL